MKFLIILSALVASVLSTPYYIEPGQVTLDTYEEYLKEQQLLNTRVETDQKIAAGIAAKKGEYPEFCYISVQFYQKQQSCGCFIWDKQYVVTAARCVVDCSEGDAANVTVTIASASGKAAVQKVEKFFVPDGMNGLEYLPIYENDGIPDFKDIVGSNVAVIKLAAELAIVEGKSPMQKAVVLSTFATYDDWAAMHKTTDGWKYRTCGVGVINNLGQRSKGVTCTEVNIKLADDCKESPTDDEPLTKPTSQLCLQWDDKENNVCVGDYGGPVYAYKVDAKGKILTDPKQEVFCVLTGSPNVRKNAGCLGGQVTFCEFIPGNPMVAGNYGWIDAIVKDLQPAPDTED